MARAGSRADSAFTRCFALLKVLVRSLDVSRSRIKDQSMDRGAFAPWQLILSAAWRTNSSSVDPWAGNDSASEDAVHNKAPPQDEVTCER